MWMQYPYKNSSFTFTFSKMLWWRWFGNQLNRTLHFVVSMDKNIPLIPTMFVNWSCDATALQVQCVGFIGSAGEDADCNQLNTLPLTLHFQVCRKTCGREQRKALYIARIWLVHRGLLSKHGSATWQTFFLCRYKGLNIEWSSNEKHRSQHFCTSSSFVS